MLLMIGSLKVHFLCKPFFHKPSNILTNPKMKKTTSKLGFFALAGTLAFTACDKKEFIYTDNNTNNNTNNNSDLTAVYDRTVNYSVIVTGQEESNFRSPAGMDGATVVVSVDGANVSVTTDASGIASFQGLKAGLVSVSVSKDGWTSANYIVDLTNSNVTGSGDIDNHSERSAATMVTLLQTANLGTSTLTGKLEIEDDQTNGDSESMPTSLATLTARVDFNNHSSNGSSNGLGGSHTGYGQIVQFYYEGLMGTRNFSIDGDAYSVTLPASAYGLPVEVYVNPFKHDNEDFGGNINEETFNVGFAGGNPTTIWANDSYTGETYITDLYYQVQ